MVGSALTSALQERGDNVAHLVRSASQADGNEIFWSPQSGVLEPAKLEGFDAVIHLAGENIAEGRWTTAKKARIRDSRVQGTQLLAQVLARLEGRPKVFLGASAIGIYGSRGNELLDERSAPGQ